MAKIVFFGLKDWEQKYYQDKNIFSVLGIEPVFVDAILDDEHLPNSEASQAEIISIFVDSKVTTKVLSAFPNLKHIATRSTGYDHIDLAVCKERGIIVSSVPGYGEVTVAEYAFALLLAYSRKIYDGVEKIKEQGDFSPEGLKGFDLCGKTIGIIGTGRIGKHAAGIAKGFGMKVVAYDVYPNEEAAKQIGFSYLSLEELLKNADVVSVHVPYTPENHHLINKDKLALMKASAVLINTARGALIDTPALVEALKNKTIAGAALDVLEEEGVLKDEFGYVMGANQEADMKAVLADHVLFDLPNVIITPHNAFNTQEALEKILDTTAENIKSFLAGAPINLPK
ncbi:MAG: NAD(P)-dependent oxidoreductase [bacterium]|nr:NAD(P)-dependent oxidoreductase [bacterium]